MASISPMIKRRRAFRALGASSEQAGEAAELIGALDSVYLSRREFEDRIARMFAENRRQQLLEMLFIAGLIVGLLTIAIAVL